MWTEIILENCTCGRDIFFKWKWEISVYKTTHVRVDVALINKKAFKISDFMKSFDFKLKCPFQQNHSTSLKKKKLCVCVCAHSFSKGELFNFRVYLNNFSLDCRQFNLLFGSFLGSRISQVVLGRQTFKKLINKSHRLCKDKINHENTLKTACSFQSCEKGPKV